jgi:hypothetical protein
MKILSEMTLVELRKIAAGLKVPGRSKLRKVALIAAIEAARTTDGAAVSAAALAPKTAKVLPSTAVSQDTAAVAAAVEEAPGTDEDMPKEVASEASPLPKRHPFADSAPSLEPLLLGGIPIGYDRDHLEIKVQSPDTLFCYWSMHSHDSRLMESGRAQIRLFDVTGAEHDLIRTEAVEPSAGRWFLRGLTPDREYRVEFGVADGDDFTSHLTSNAARTPPLAASRIEDVALVTLAFRDDDRPAPAEIPPPLFHTPSATSADLRSVAGLRPFAPGKDAGASEWDHGVAVGTSEGQPLELKPAPASGHPDSYESWGSHSLGA